MRKNLTPKYEHELFQKGYELVIGIDEAGRGPWAGPLQFAAYIFQPGAHYFRGINDSKLVPSPERRKFYDKLILTPENYLLSSGSNEEIDGFGLAGCISRLLSDIVRQVADKFQSQKKIFLIDGYFKDELDCEYEYIKKGDRKIYSIAAASIIAKVTRDSLMHDYAKEYPDYGFDKHKGYGTKLHREMLLKYGTCPIHRQSFKPVKGFIRS